MMKRHSSASCPCTQQIQVIRSLLRRPDWSGADMLQEIYDIVNPRRSKIVNPRRSKRR